jgi:hypothetical protein
MTCADINNFEGVGLRLVAKSIEDRLYSMPLSDVMIELPINHKSVVDKAIFSYCLEFAESHFQDKS